MDQPHILTVKQLCQLRNMDVLVERLSHGHLARFPNPRPIYHHTASRWQDCVGGEVCGWRSDQLRGWRSDTGEVLHVYLARGFMQEEFCSFWKKEIKHMLLPFALLFIFPGPHLSPPGPPAILSCSPPARAFLLHCTAFPLVFISPSPLSGCSAI